MWRLSPRDHQCYVYIARHHFLDRADLIAANLRGANLHDAILTGANLRDANLGKANLEGANLSGANVTSEQLDKATSLKGATMPDGTKHE